MVVDSGVVHCWPVICAELLDGTVFAVPALLCDARV